MEYRTLGRTGVQVSALCLGTMNFGTRTDLEASYEIIDRAIDEGINFIDTANLYGMGKSEEAVGRALKRDGKRAHVILATKVHFSMDDSDPNSRGNSRRHILEQCDASLRRLQTEWIDLYQLHRAHPSVPIDETLRALDDLVRAGKVRYTGTSTFAAWQLVESLWASREYGLSRFVSEQPPYNLLDRRIERELIPMAQTFGMAIVPWSPLGGGLLTGKYRRDQKPEGSRYHDNWKSSDIKGRWNDRVFDVVEGLEPIAKAKGTSLPKFAMAWVLAQPGVTSPLAGPRTMEQLEEYLDALTVKITVADREQVDAVIPPGDHVSPFYEGAFGPHPFRVF